MLVNMPSAPRYRRLSLPLTRPKTVKVSKAAKAAAAAAAAVESKPNQGNFFTDWMAELNNQPVAGNGGPNSIYSKYTQVALEYNDVDKPTANRIREHGRQKVQESFPNWVGGTRKWRTRQPFYEEGKSLFVKGLALDQSLRKEGNSLLPKALEHASIENTETPKDLRMNPHFQHRTNVLL